MLDVLFQYGRVSTGRLPWSRSEEKALKAALKAALFGLGRLQPLVEAVVANGPQAVKASKRLVQDMAGQPITPALREDSARRIADIRGSAEGKEGVTAFLQKRAPAWLPLPKA